MYQTDQGTNFGKWTDTISQFMYQSSTKDILNLISIPNKVADYGGANSNMKSYIPNLITIDIDGTKNPDIHDNIINHKGEYDLIIIRYVLHYLNDYEVLELFNNIKQYHKGQVLIIQFTNEDLKSKYKNSINEFKYFRTENQLEELLPHFTKIYTKDYKVTKEFYLNRLNNPNGINHQETLNGYLINYD